MTIPTRCLCQALSRRTVALAERSPEDLAREGAPIVLAQREEIQRATRLAHPLQLGDVRVEAVNAARLRSHIGHDLSKRMAFGNPIGVVYRVTGERVDVSIYSIGAADGVYTSPGSTGYVHG